MAATEDVIQYACELKPPSHLDDGLTAPLLAWRTLLRRLGLIGQSPSRYGGLGYGNISRRIPQAPRAFIITASQTSGLTDAGPADLIRVNSCDLQGFAVQAEGAKPPSSEAPTHAMAYAADTRINWVMHSHCPEIWRNAQALRLPVIDADVQYGSPPMAQAVAALLNAKPVLPVVFATLGHEDGVFACAESAEDAGGALVNCLALGMALKP